jgi:hypothetical protein
MSSRTVQRHDQFFQQLLDKPGLAGRLLRERLPPEVVDLLVDEPPELVPGSFVSQRLRGYRTDRLYRTRTRAGRQVLVYALIEHKSKPDPRIGLQLLGYHHQILEHWDRTEGKAADGLPRLLPAVVSLVVYHGAAEWTVPLSLSATTDAEAALHPYILDFRYSLADLGRIPDADLSPERILRVGLLILKHGALSRATRKTLLRLAQEALRLGYDDLVTLVCYLLGDLDGPKGELIRGVLHELLPGEEERIMSVAAEQWKAEGFHNGMLKGLSEGRAEGRAEGMARILAKQLSRRFGPLPAEIEDRLRTAEADRLEAWSDALLDAPTLADVFR